MSVLGTISLSGLTTTNADVVTAQYLEVQNNLTVDNGATITLPNASIPDNSLSSNVPLENSINHFTGTNNFDTSTVNVSPLKINYTGTPNQSVLLSPNCTDYGFNPYCLNGDCYVGSSGNLVIGKQNQFNAIRFTDTSLNFYAQNEITMTVNDFQAASITQTNLNINTPFISNYLSSGPDYENYFVGDIFSEQALTCNGGLYIQNGGVVGSTTYAVIDASGNAILSTLASTAKARDVPTYTTNNTLGVGRIQLYPNVSTSFLNPLVKNNDCLLSSNGPVGSALTICRETTNATGFRIDNSTLKFGASGAVQFWLQNSTSGSYSGFTSTGELVLQDGLNVGGAAFIDTAGVVSAPSADITTITSTTITTTTQTSTDNSTKVATTAFVKNLSYAEKNFGNTFSQPNTFSNSTFFTGPITPPRTVVASNSTIQGFQILPTISAPTGNTTNVLASVLFDNTTNSFGTYFFEYHMTINTTSAQEMKCALSTVSGSLTGNHRDSVYTPAVSFDSNMNNSGMFRIYSPITWYLNFLCPSGTYTWVNSFFRITRVA